MHNMVVGIFPDHDTLAKLADGIKAGGFNIEHLRVISNDTPSENLIRTGLRFIYSGDAEPTAIAGGGGIITSFGGTEVPGLTNVTTQVGSPHGDPSTEDLLGELEIPGGRNEDYSRALDAGRSVAGYHAGADVDRVKAIFSAAGGNPVDVY
jgi:hypothetical protein